MIEHAKTYNNHPFNLVEKSNVNNANKIEINHCQTNNAISEKTSTNNINHINSNATNNISSERTNILSPKENFQETQRNGNLGVPHIARWQLLSVVFLLGQTYRNIDCGYTWHCKKDAIDSKEGDSES